MTREEKNAIIDSLAESINGANHFYLTDTSNLNAADTSLLRRKCHMQDVKLLVVKNTLLKKALEKAEGEFEDLYEVLKDSTSIIFSETGNIPAKLIKDFRKNHARPILKAAFVEESVYIGDDQLEFLSSFKSKEELITEVVLLLQSPMKTLLSQLQSGSQALSGVLKTLSEKKN